MSARHLTTLSITGALSVAALLLTVTPMTHAQATSSTTAGGARTGAAADQPPSRQVPAAEQRAVKRLDHKRIAGQSEPLALPTPRPLPARATAPLSGVDGPAVTVRGTKPSTAISLRSTSTVTTSRAATDVTGTLWPGVATANPNRQVGKLYFDTDPSPTRTAWNHCTATAINSENRSTVLTAGHCVWDITNRRWYTQLWFYPGYENGARLGAWQVRQMSTTSNYYNYGTSADDMAVVVVNRDSAGVPLVNRVGGQGIAFNQPVGVMRTSLGYPKTDSRWPGWTSAGEDLYYCQGRDTYYSSGSLAGQMVLSCRMTGGASGGPWLSNVPSTWLGTVTSVNSNKGWVGSQGAPWMFGPYMGAQELAVFQAYRAF